MERADLKDLLPEKLSEDLLALMPTILDMLPGFVFIKSIHGRYVYVNQNFARYYQKDPKDLTGLTDLDLGVNHDEVIRYELEDQWVLENKKVHESQVFSIINSNGDELKIKTLKKPIFNEQGNVTLILGISQDLTAVIEAEKQKIFAQNKFLRLFQNNPDPIIVVNLHFNFLLEVNEAARSFFAIEDLKSLGQNPRKFLTDRFQGVEGESLIQPVLETDKESRIKVNFNTPKNGVRHLEVSKFLLDMQEKGACALVFRDLTENHQTIEELKNSREYVKVLFDHAPEGMLVLELPDGFILDCNAKAEQLLGMVRDDLINLQPEELGSPHLHELQLNKEFWKNISNQAISNGHVSFEWKLKHPTRGKFPAAINLVRLPGYRQMFQMSISDISERKLSENALKESEEKFRNLYEFSPIGIVISDSQMKILFANPATTQLLGYSESELQNIDIREICHEEDMERNSQMLNEAKNGLDHYSLRKRYFRKDGRMIYVDLSVAVIRDEDGQVRYLIGNLLDMTESVERRKRLEEQNQELTKVNQELNNLVYRTSHDLRAPIVSLMGLSDLIKSSQEQEERNQMIDMMNGQLKKLDHVIQDIIDYRKVSLVDLKKEKVDVQAIAIDVIESIRFSRNVANINLIHQFNIHEEVISDPYPIRVILNNLISNAVKYSDAEKDNQEIRLLVQSQNGQLSIHLEDNGIGIDEAYLPRVYDMFFRGTEKSTGTGLGLYIVHWAVTRLGGQISLTSVLGKGTTFKVIIPNQLA